MVNSRNMKMTPVGLIPEDWDVIQLADHVVDINDGPFGSNLKSEHYTLDREVRIIQLGNVGDNGWNDENVKYTTFEHASTLKRCIVPYGTIIIAKMMPAGRAIVCPSSEPAYIQGSDVIKVVFSDSIDKDFFIYLTKSKVYLEQIESGVQGSTRARTNIGKIKSLKLPLPSIEEQKRIAGALLSVDKMIGALDEAITKKSQIKEGLMQQLLTGEAVIPEYSGEWQKKRVGDIGFTYSGLTGKTKNDFGHGESQYITFLNVLNNPVLNTDAFEKVDVRSDERQNAAKKGDLFFNTSSETPEEVGICALLSADINNLYLNSFCFGFRLTDPDVNGLYLSYFWRSKQGREIMSGLAQGATRYNLSKEYFNKAIITLPPIELQRYIANTITVADKEIAELEQKRDKYLLIKQGMMQELLTGKTRLV